MKASLLSEIPAQKIQQTQKSAVGQELCSLAEVASDEEKDKKLAVLSAMQLAAGPKWWSYGTRWYRRRKGPQSLASLHIDGLQVLISRLWRLQRERYGRWRFQIHSISFTLS